MLHTEYIISHNSVCSRSLHTVTRQAIDVMLAYYTMSQALHEVIAMFSFSDLVVNPLSTLYSISLCIMCLALQW